MAHGCFWSGSLHVGPGSLYLVALPFCVSLESSEINAMIVKKQSYATGQRSLIPAVDENGRSPKYKGIDAAGHSMAFHQKIKQ